MLIYVNITDRQTDRRTDGQTHQKYSSEHHKTKKTGFWHCIAEAWETSRPVHSTSSTRRARRSRWLWGTRRDGPRQCGYSPKKWREAALADKARSRSLPTEFPARAGTWAFSPTLPIACSFCGRTGTATSWCTLRRGQTRASSPFFELEVFRLELVVWIDITKIESIKQRD